MNPETTKAVSSNAAIAQVINQIKGLPAPFEFDVDDSNMRRWIVLRFLFRLLCS